MSVLLRYVHHVQGHAPAHIVCTFDGCAADPSARCNNGTDGAVCASLQEPPARPKISSVMPEEPQN